MAGVCEGGFGEIPQFVNGSELIVGEREKKGVRCREVIANGCDSLCGSVAYEETISIELEFLEVVERRGRSDHAHVAVLVAKVAVDSTHAEIAGWTTVHDLNEF